MLTATACKNAKAKDKVKKFFDGAGLYLEVSPKGNKYWRLKYYFNGKEKRLALGVFPTVSLAEAREMRARAKREISVGVDPSFAKQELKRQRFISAENTFEPIAREWHQHNLDKWGKKHAYTVIRRFEMDVFPAIGGLPIKDINALRILEMLKAIERRGAKVLARRAMQLSSSVFRYAIITGRADTDPTAALKGALKPYKKGHHKALESRDLPDFLRALKQNNQRLFPLTRMGMELLMLTFVRTGELVEAEWNEFDFAEATWTIPAERMKMNKSHIVPLSRQVVNILKEIERFSYNSKYVFPQRANIHKHMSNGAFLMAIRRMGYQEKTTGHGFRALAMSTIKEKLGYRHEVIDRQLAHSPKTEIIAAYDRAQFLDERKKMMQDWADYISNIIRENAKKLVRVI